MRPCRGRMRVGGGEESLGFASLARGRRAGRAGRPALGWSVPLTNWEYDLRRLSGALEENISFVARLARLLIFYDLPEWIFTVAHVLFGILWPLRSSLRPQSSAVRRSLPGKHRWRPLLLRVESCLKAGVSSGGAGCPMVNHILDRAAEWPNGFHLDGCEGCKQTGWSIRENDLSCEPDRIP